MDVSGNPWVVYPGDVVPGDFVPIYPQILADEVNVGSPQGRVFVDLIQWANYTAVGQVCDIKDELDRDVFFRIGLASLEPIELSLSDMRAGFRGLRLWALDAGQLYIYVK